MQGPKREAKHPQIPAVDQQLFESPDTTSSSMILLLLVFALLSLTRGQSSCSSSVEASTSPVAIDGFAWDIIATNLSNARGIIFDSQGRLLVVQRGTGITALTLSNDSCAIITSTSTVLQNSSLNHGIEFSVDGGTLYASSGDNAWSWRYNISDASVSDARLIVSGMGGTSHSTRTLHISPVHPNLLVVSRGSDGNIDPSAASITSGHSQVKVFDLNKIPDGGYDYTKDGGVLAYGVRNEVGITSDSQGHIWGVENSADQLERNNTTISKDNPAEKLNYCTSLNPKFIKSAIQQIQNNYISDIPIVLQYGIHHLSLPH
jgi:glucose/arabinose dehydrogenase